MISFRQCQCGRIFLLLNSEHMYAYNILEVNVMLMANQLRDDEEQIIREYVFLPLIKLALQRDKKVINITNTKFKDLYLASIDEAIHRVTTDMRKNKDAVFDHHIRLTRKDWLSYEVNVRGRVFPVSYHKTAAAEWIGERVKEYL